MGYVRVVGFALVNALKGGTLFSKKDRHQDDTVPYGTALDATVQKYDEARGLTPRRTVTGRPGRVSSGRDR